MSNPTCPYFEPCTDFHARWMTSVSRHYPELLGDHDVLTIALICRMRDEGRITSDEHWMLEDAPMSRARAKFARFDELTEVRS